MLEDEDDPLTRAVIGAAIEVHRVMGPGLLESVYQRCLCHELKLRSIPHKALVSVAIRYKGLELGNDLVLDVLVDDRLILELKAVDKLDAVHEAQLLTYLRLTGVKLGLLINFNVRLLKEGIWRRIL